MMRLVTSLGLVLMLLALAAAPALAEEHGGEHGGADALIQPDLWTIALTIAVFVLLLIVLSKTAWKPILNALKQREDTIAKALDDAKIANERAQQKIAEYEAKIQQAKDEAQEIADEARRDAEEARGRLHAQAQEESAAIIERAKREIEQLSAKAWDGIVRDAAQVATEAARRIIQQDLSEEGHAAIVADVVSQFARTGSAGGSEA